MLKLIILPLLVIAIAFPAGSANLVGNGDFELCWLTDPYWATEGHREQLWCAMFRTPVPPQAGDGMASQCYEANGPCFDQLYQPVDFAGFQGRVNWCVWWRVETQDTGADAHDFCFLRLRTADMRGIIMTLFAADNRMAYGEWTHTCDYLEDAASLGEVNFSLEAVTNGDGLETFCNWDGAVVQAWPGKVFLPGVWR